ncbi:MAG: phasin family protein [Xanthobacteraceae bacterium]
MAEFATLLESGAVVEKLPPPAAATARRLQATDDRTLQQLDEVTLAAAKSAKDYRVWMLENLKIGSSTTPDSANAVAGAAPTFADPRAEKPREQGVDGDAPIPEPQLSGDPDAAIADDYRAKAVELINANVNATLDYAQQLGTVKSATEFIELSTSHAHRHLELIMKHAAGFTALSGTSPTKIPTDE